MQFEPQDDVALAAPLREWPKYDHLHARQYECDLQRMPLSPFRTEFATWMHQRELNKRLEMEEQQLMKRREEWSKQLTHTATDVVPSELRQRRLPMDDRMLPPHAWHSIYHRFSRRHNFLLGRDQAGCDDEDDVGKGLKGTTVDIYNVLTGTFVCTVDVGIDHESLLNSPLDLYDVAREVERWSEYQGKRQSEGFFAECLHFFPRPQKNWQRELPQQTYLRDISHGEHRFDLNMMRSVPSRVKEFLNQERQLDNALECVNRIRAVVDRTQTTDPEKIKSIFTSADHEDTAKRPVVRWERCTTCSNPAHIRCVNCCWAMCIACRAESPWGNIAPMCHACVLHAQWGRPRDEQNSSQ